MQDADQAVQSLLTRADELMDAGKLLEARDLYTAACQLDAENIDTWLILAAIDGEYGKVESAIAHCQRAIALDSQDCDAQIMLGRLLMAGGQYIEARVSLSQAVLSNEENSDAWDALAVLQLAQGDYDEAERCGRESIRWAPRHTGGYINLGHALRARGSLLEAASAFIQATHIEPEHALAWHELGVTQESLGNWVDATASYQKAIRMTPTLWSAHTGLARVLCKNGNPEVAEKGLRAVCELQPDNAFIQFALGMVNEHMQRPTSAEACYRCALQLNPNMVEAWIDLGNLLQARHVYEEAEQSYRQALVLAPNNASAHFNRGVAFQRQGHFEKALASFDQAIDLRADFVEAHWYKSFICLLLGDFEQGWMEYEWRLRQAKAVRRLFTQPAWDGSSLLGKTILVHDEQGYGDTFQFVRYLPMLKALGARVVLECHEHLGPILQGCGSDVIIERKSPQQIPEVAFDVHIHLMSLPNILATRIGTIPTVVPYLTVDARRVKYWHSRVASMPGYKIGIAWAGSENHTNELNRSCRLIDFAPLAGISGVTFYSLQKGVGAEQADHPPPGMNLVRVDHELDMTERFVDTAALMVNLDLVVTIDTSVAHLAGALGCPVWTLICATPDWRWMLGRVDSPWYPTMRLYRQTSEGWQAVFKELSMDLQQCIKTIRR